MRAFIKFLLLQGKEPKEIQAILTETFACFLPGRAKDLSAPLYKNYKLFNINRVTGTKDKSNVRVLKALFVELISNKHYGYFFIVALRPKASHGLLIHEVSRSHTATHHSR